MCVFLVYLPVFMFWAMFPDLSKMNKWINEKSPHVRRISTLT